MKKKVLLRALLGAPIGLSIGFLVTLLVSAGFGDGKFYPVTPELTALCGTELRAVAVQTAVLLLCGAVWAAASVIWETEWSLLRQTVTHLLACSLSALPAAYFMHWVPHTVEFWATSAFFSEFTPESGWEIIFPSAPASAR